MPSASVTRFNAHRSPRRKEPKIVTELRHALLQQYLQSKYPGREPTPDLPKSEYSPWPSAYDEEE